METHEGTDVAPVGSAASENPYRFDAVDDDQVVSGKTPFLSRFCGGLCAIAGLLGMLIGTLASSGSGAVGIVAAFVGSVGLLLVAWGLERDCFWAHCCFTSLVILAAIVVLTGFGFFLPNLLLAGVAVCLSVFMLVRRRNQG